MSDFEKLIVLTFDEVYLSNKIAIDRKKQQVVGPHKTCQCVMVWSLFWNWKQPVYYNYNTPMIRDKILHIISRLHDAGYTIIIQLLQWHAIWARQMALWSEL